MACMTTACLNDHNDDESNYTTHSDAAITTFTLGKLKQYVHTISSQGTDSVYTKDVVGSKYPMYIDQINNKIYNVDSLPYGTDVSKVIATVAAKNGGTVGLRAIDKDSLYNYRASDSIDFSVERVFVVASYDGKNLRYYDVKLNVHKETTDYMIWENGEPFTPFATAKELKAVEKDNNIIVYASDGSTTNGYSSLLGNDIMWTKLNINTPLQPEACKNIVSQNGGCLWTINGNQLMRSDDGATWETATSFDMTNYQLIGASKNKLYALHSGQIEVMATDNVGGGFEIDQIDESNSLLPTGAITMISQPLYTNLSSDRLTLVGNRDNSLYPNDYNSMVWTKISDYGNSTQNNIWTFVGSKQKNEYGLPNLHNIVVAPYNNSILAFGGYGQGSFQEDAFSKIYISRDNGLTWQSSNNIILPTTMDCPDEIYTILSDSNNYLWIICGGSGQTWKGCLNSLKNK